MPYLVIKGDELQLFDWHFYLILFTLSYKCLKSASMHRDSCSILAAAILSAVGVGMALMVTIISLFYIANYCTTYINNCFFMVSGIYVDSWYWWFSRS